MADFEDKDSKTEEATPRKRMDAREKGQVGFSSEIMSAVMLLATVGAGAVFGRELFEALGSSVTEHLLALRTAGTTELATQDASAIVQSAGL